MPALRNFSRLKFFSESEKLLAVVAIFVMALLVAPPMIALGAPQNPGANWFGPNGNYPFNWDYADQSQITSANVQNLQISWVYPVPAGPSVYGQTTGNDIVVTPVVVNGISYVITDYHLLIAQNLKDGAIVWERQLPTQTFKGLETLWDAEFGNIGGNITGHYHGLWYSSSILHQPLIWLETNNNTVYAYNALNGDPALKIPTFLAGEKIPGNYGLYGTQSRSLLIDDQRGILLVGSGGEESSAAGRGYFAAYDVSTTPPKLMWRSFIHGPQDGSDPKWAVSSVANMSYAYIFDGTAAVNLKTLPNSTLYQVLYRDWGNFGFNGTHSYAGVDTAWGGSWAMDQKSGIAYVATQQPGADWNASTRPGPNLWSDSVLAVDVTSGKFLWAFQTTAHDTWDWDCSWSIMLANVTINGQEQPVVYKGCKNGYFYALSARTGALLWYFNPPNIARTRYSMLYNPLNVSQMKLPWSNYPSTDTFLQSPGGAGGFESNPAYNPNTGLVYVAAFNAPGWTKITPIKGPGVPYSAGGSSPTATGPPLTDNTTIYALNGSTGKIVWSYYIPKIGYRGGLSTTSDLVIVPRADGNLDFINAQTGKLIIEKFIGSALITEPAVAADASGNMAIVLPASGSTIGTGLLVGAGVFSQAPGFMFALSPVNAAQVSTVTKEKITTVTTTMSSGIDTTTFYAVSGLLVIFVVATGVLVVRRGKSTA